MGSNCGFPSKPEVEAQAALFPAGCRVELVSMADPYTDLKPGDQGTVAFVDSTGTVFIDWDSGSSLGAVFGIDQILTL